MESQADTYRGIIESPADWEAGNAETRVARTDYSRTSPPDAGGPVAEDEANSDLGNLGRDVEDEAVAGSQRQ